MNQKLKFNIIFSSYYLSTTLIGYYCNYKKHPNKLPIVY